MLVGSDSYWAGAVHQDKPVFAEPGQASTKGFDGHEFLQGSRIHNRGPLETFINTLDDPQKCGNLLDIGSQDMSRPWFVK
jgi:hypothetical protein